MSAESTRAAGSPDRGAADGGSPVEGGSGGSESPDGGTLDRGALDQGTYEIIRDRLVAHGRNLGQKTEDLNRERIGLFGGQEMAIVGNERLRTQNNCVPRDIVAVGNRVLFGYNVFIGLKTETAVDDVFNLHRFVSTPEGTFAFEPVEAGCEDDFLGDPKFVNDFKELYRYYKQARLTGLREVPGKILAIFQIGGAAADIRVFRWSVDPAGRVAYIDNRGERDNVFPPRFDFEWTATTRDQHVLGRHPHVSILDQVFVETVGGDLTIKVENNTEDGLGIYQEPVEDAHQSLQDAQIQYARLGTIILIRILPYRETTWRHLVFNTRTKQVARVDAIGQSCVQLPEDHGIIFPGGYYLSNGVYRTFDYDTSGMAFVEKVASPNGEDVLYVFHHDEDCRHVLLPYNLIRKEVANAIPCAGHSLFDDGRMLVFRPSEEASRVHAMQIWQTPFTAPEVFARTPTTGSYLEKIGNVDLVRGIADAMSIRRRIDDQKPTVANYEDLISAANRALDAYHWMGRAEVGDLAGILREIRATAELVLDEFEKVQALQAQAGQAVRDAEAAFAALKKTLRDAPQSIQAYVDALSRLRTQRGQLISLRDMRYIDRPALESLETQVLGLTDEVGARTVAFLLQPDAFQAWHDDARGLETALPAIEKTSDLEPLRQKLDAIAAGLELLRDTVGTLKIEDTTVRTRILEPLAELFGVMNRVRALATNRRKELVGREGVAEFGIQFQLFAQNVDLGLSLADTPENADGQLSKLLLALEELESRFSEFEEFAEKLATRREEVLEAFSARKQMLLEQRQRRAQNLASAASRILEGVARRTFESQDALNAFFAADPMVAKVHDLVAQLRQLGVSVKADEVSGRLKSVRDEAARALRDRTDIFESGGTVIKLGRHRFSVNTQALDLVLVPRDDRMTLHLSGTDYFEPIQDAELEKSRALWDQQLASETPEVYRGEYLAACLLADAEQGREGLTLERLYAAASPREVSSGGPVDGAASAPAGQAPPQALLGIVREYIQGRYDEGYERGLHDVDAALILDRLLDLHRNADLLRFSPRARAAACLFAPAHDDPDESARWQRQARSLARLRSTVGYHPAIAALGAEMSDRIRAFAERQGVALHPDEATAAGLYLFEEISRGDRPFALSAEAEQLRADFVSWLEGRASSAPFFDDLKALEGDLVHQYALALAWMEAFVGGTGRAGGHPVLQEAVVLVLTEARLPREVARVPLEATVEGLLGQHPRIDNRRLHLRLDEFLARLGQHRLERAPEFRRFVALRHSVVERERVRLRLADYQTKVMSSFVRNRLINEVYLPLIGDNLAKQVGSIDQAKRTDLMGMLLLVSPPGYGKTTLMEYVANRLGLVFMKINGPAIGSHVTSLDPADAPNATAREEVDKINLALEMGNNVMLYVDDIQHTSPEFLQKFISLCDAQRKIEGVWRGQVRTYDMRGKRFCVCMAGNPYTESGQKFQIPDMLANRADTYNLGEILQGRDELFALSYVENALTSNATLSPLASRDLGDLYKLVAMAKGAQIAADELSHPYSGLEIQEILDVLRKLGVVQELLLAVNRAYIASAAQDDAFRTEPPFKLQGSYRNMNKLAEKVVAVMNEDELQRVIDDHYRGEAQTLTTGAEHNLLKLAELRGRMSVEQQERWLEIKRGFQRRQMLGGREDDPVARVTAVLGTLAQGVEDIGGAIVSTGEAAGRVASAVGQDAVARFQQVAESLSRTSAPPAVDLSVHLSSLHEALGRLAESRPAPPAVSDELLTRLTAALEGLARAPVVVTPGVTGAVSGAMQAVVPMQAAVPGQAVVPMPAAVPGPAVGPVQTGPVVGAPGLDGAAQDLHRQVLALVARLRGPEARVIILDRALLDFLNRAEKATTMEDLLLAMEVLNG